MIPIKDNFFFHVIYPFIISVMFFLFPYFSPKLLFPFNPACVTMWVVCQADDPFVCFGAKPNKGLRLEIFDEIGSGEEGGPREDRWSVGKGNQRGSVGKGTQRRSVGEERRREVVENGAEGTSQRWAGIPSGFCRSFE